MGEFLQGFSLVLLFLSTLGIISCQFLVDSSLYLVLVRSQCHFYISWASNFYVLRHFALVDLGHVLV